MSKLNMPLSIIIVDKTGVLKLLTIKDFLEEDLFKKCGFKKSENFDKHTEWKLKYPKNGPTYVISVYGKDDGRANSENKYDFPPPIDNKLFFGSCAIVAKMKNSNNILTYTNLSLELWEKIYEELFGGFEDLALTAAEDENEEDELANVPKEKKTKHGYLKDGFVVDSDKDNDDEEDENGNNYESDEEEDGDSESEEIETNEDDVPLEEIGSELSEDKYDYSDSEDSLEKTTGK
jgi:hypothetical protein